MKFRHVKRDTLYEILDIIKVKNKNWKDGEVVKLREQSWLLDVCFQHSNPSGDIMFTYNFDGGFIVIYYPVEPNGHAEMYARPVEEFFDGRFEREAI